MTVILLLSVAAAGGFLGACERGGVSREIRFAVSRNGVGESVTLRDARFYIHRIELLAADGTVHAFKFTAASPWQNQQVALVDLAGPAAEQRNEVLQGKIDVDAGRYVGIRFAVGVPFALNHANPLTAAAPLNRADLFWTWQSGYKFIRIEFADQNREWAFHLGSTGCSSASALRPPTQVCAQPNVMQIELRGFDPLREPVQLRLDQMVSAMHAAEFRTCTGAYAHNPACENAFANTGLSFDTGTCPQDHCAGQQLFGGQ